MASIGECTVVVSTLSSLFCDRIEDGYRVSGVDGGLDLSLDQGYTEYPGPGPV